MKISSKKYCSAAYFSQVQELWSWYQSDLPYLEVQTSGTTGRPKKIQIPRSALLHSAQLSIDFFKLNTNSQILLCLPLDKIGGIMLAIRAFRADAEITPVEPQSNPFAALGGTAPFDFVSLVPNQLAATEAHWSQLKTILVGGGPINEALQNRLVNSGLDTQVYHSYASTETISHVALKRIYPNGESYYRALAGVRFRVNADNCLVIDAPDLEVHQLETKDVVQLENESTFTWRGRFDNVVLSGGLKLYPEEIEKKISWPFPFYLSGMEDEKLGEQLVLVMLQSDYNEDLHDLLKAQLSGKERPKQFVLLRKIQRTANGKIKRNESLAESRTIIPV